ncbi:hypothetical protein A2303_02575 [Candidatus Falkowbacteria bacterium RIFOXYB2_FULL_47_14]|uniref:Uncharacterized protein n=1 Tax=Candidatus Falkowbacteria bacterium RIFOXYA2_FULL_47_19 TaxID=1797994 RepID=A0A1F5SK03_9BACT|nr:MAG: hypothetical protein A2227_06295 [Candidatus Falkowbacteria bacterium RIFOXYA2_FULL_47_19]OGF35919.1 MAG: hypothetical protein A2468_01750 [Candidatus Falkowbacteria bacterium RIFOXYC2_FULL_46_15]OGF43944.1 MAG: hypothetical protein A2303_02575 [Candidatus Falkowbacteria bacterium RIFOXYB2_FULL_47_14]
MQKFRARKSKDLHWTLGYWEHEELYEVYYPDRSENFKNLPAFMRFDINEDGLRQLKSEGKKIQKSRIIWLVLESGRIKKEISSDNLFRVIELEGKKLLDSLLSIIYLHKHYHSASFTRVNAPSKTEKNMVVFETEDPELIKKIFENNFKIQKAKTVWEDA